MMNYICEHGEKAWDCVRCHDDARALSELQQFGTFIPQVTRCSKHKLVPLTEHWDCIICTYSADMDEESSRESDT